jgi:hypothetical protein
MTRKIKEGRMTGASPTQTGAMAGRFMGRLKQSVASGETDSSVLDKKRAQARRIQGKVAARQARFAPSHGADAAQTFNKSSDRFGKFYRRGQGTGSTREPEYENAPQNAPNPTDVKRRARGLKPYRASTELVRGARLALAERIIEGLTTGGDAEATGRRMARATLAQNDRGRQLKSLYGPRKKSPEDFHDQERRIAGKVAARTGVKPESPNSYETGFAKEVVKQDPANFQRQGHLVRRKPSIRIRVGR